MARGTHEKKHCHKRDNRTVPSIPPPGRRRFTMHRSSQEFSPSQASESASSLNESSRRPSFQEHQPGASHSSSGQQRPPFPPRFPSNDSNEDAVVSEQHSPELASSTSPFRHFHNEFSALVPSGRRLGQGAFNFHHVPRSYSQTFSKQHLNAQEDDNNAVARPAGVSHLSLRSPRAETDCFSFSFSIVRVSFSRSTSYTLSSSTVYLWPDPHLNLEFPRYSFQTRLLSFASLYKFTFNVSHSPPICFSLLLVILYPLLSTRSIVFALTPYFSASDVLRGQQGGNSGGRKFLGSLRLRSFESVEVSEGNRELLSAVSCRSSSLLPLSLVSSCPVHTHQVAATMVQKSKPGPKRRKPCLQCDVGRFSTTEASSCLVDLRFASLILYGNS